MTPPVVSVVVIFLNAERFLDEAIQSVIGQTWPHWELLLVDDGSSDASAQVAPRYATADPERVRYLEHPGHQNRGMSASRNLGIRNASGDFLAFLDADDVWLPHKLERQVAILAAHPDVALLFGAPLYWFGWTGREQDRERDYVIDLRIETERIATPPELVTAFLTGVAPPPCPSDILVRRRCALEVGGFEPEFRGMYEDQAFLAKVLLREPAYISSECWDYYRQHPTSCYAVAKTTGTRDVARHYYLRWLRQYLQKQGRNHGPVWQTVLTKLEPYSLPVRLRRRARQEVRRTAEQGRRFARAVLPSSLRRWIRATLRREVRPSPGEVRFGSFRRLTPISRQFGWDRGGLPIDRYYIERFLECHASDIRGHVLEVRDDSYTRKFGENRVSQVDVLHVTADNPKATIVADLARAEEIPSDTFDCIVLTQVLPFIPDVSAAVRTIHRILRPGGVVLATMPGISQIIRYDMDRWGDYWRFTSLSARRMFDCGFPRGDVQVEAHGNVLAATAFLHGLSGRELRPEELDHQDPDYEVLITVRAVKSRSAPQPAAP